MTLDSDSRTAGVPHAVARLRAARLARASKPFLARGGSRQPHCPACRLVPSHCMCALRPQPQARAGVCLLMHDIEPLKPSNTGWLVADVVAETFAFGWTRTAADPALLALLAQPHWQPYVVFPAQDVPAPRAVLHTLAPPAATAALPARTPLFVLLDATWAEARKMFRKSPYLERFPVLSLPGDLASGLPGSYRLRHAAQAGQWCTSEVAALCLHLAGEARAGAALHAWQDVFVERYEQARAQRPARPESAAHQRLARLVKEPPCAVATPL